MRPVRFVILATLAACILSACAPTYQDVGDPSDGSNSKTKHHSVSTDR